MIDSVVHFYSLFDLLIPDIYESLSRNHMPALKISCNTDIFFILSSKPFCEGNGENNTDNRIGKITHQTMFVAVS